MVLSVEDMLIGCSAVFAVGIDMIAVFVVVAVVVLELEEVLKDL